MHDSIVVNYCYKIRPRCDHTIRPFYFAISADLERRQFAPRASVVRSCFMGRKLFKVIANAERRFRFWIFGLVTNSGKPVLRRKACRNETMPRWVGQNWKTFQSSVRWKRWGIAADDKYIPVAKVMVCFTWYRQCSSEDSMCKAIFYITSCFVAYCWGRGTVILSIANASWVQFLILIWCDNRIMPGRRLSIVGEPS